MIKSAINPALTLDYILSSPENKYFDVKSAAIKPSDIYAIICAFANAEGGTLVLGVEDKKRIIEGIKSVGNNKINEFLNAPKSGCKPMPIL